MSRETDIELGIRLGIEYVAEVAELSASHHNGPARDALVGLQRALKNSVTDEDITLIRQDITLIRRVGMQ